MLFKKSLFLVILQVSTDSQILKGSKFEDNYDFIYKLLTIFYFKIKKYKFNF